MGEIFDLLLELARERGIVQKEKEKEDARPPEGRPLLPSSGTARERKNLRPAG